MASGGTEARFLAWLASRGTTLHPAVALHDFSSLKQGRGAIATENIPKGTILFSLPRPPIHGSPLLTIKTSELFDRLGEAERRPLAKGWNSLILAMMWEQARALDPRVSAEESFGPYFDIMPDSSDTLMFWTPEELAELQASSVKDKVGVQQAEEDYRDIILPLVTARPDVFIVPSLATSSQDFYSLDKYHRMGTLILSRSFHVSAIPTEDEEDEEQGGSDNRSASQGDVSMDEPADQAASEEASANGVRDDVEDVSDDDEDHEDVADIAMVPLADILNAQSGKENARLFYEAKVLNMVSTKNIPAGTQIYNTYANPPNADLLRRYGHVDHDNPFDIVEVGLDFCIDVLKSSMPPANREQLVEKAEWAVEAGVDDIFELSKPAEGRPLPSELISALRIMLSSEEDYHDMKRKDKVPKAKLDADVLRAATSLVDARAAQYPTSIEEDEQILSSKAQIGSRLWKAVTVRLGEKRILRDISIALGTKLSQKSKRAGEGVRQEGRQKKHKA